MLKESAGMSKTNISLDTFATYFKAVNNPSDPYFSPDEDAINFNERYLNNELHVMFAELDSTITDIEIGLAIKQLKTCRSGGPDMLLNEFFIHGSQQLLPVLTALFNSIFNIGYFPDSWSYGDT